MGGFLSGLAIGLWVVVGLGYMLESSPKEARYHQACSEIDSQLRGYSWGKVYCENGVMFKIKNLED